MEYIGWIEPKESEQLSAVSKEMLNRVNDITIGLVILTCVILSILGILKSTHNNVHFKGSDVPNYSKVTQYIQSVIDFWTDVCVDYGSLFLNSCV